MTADRETPNSTPRPTTSGPLPTRLNHGVTTLRDILKQCGADDDGPGQGTDRYTVLKTIAETDTHVQLAVRDAALGRKVRLTLLHQPPPDERQRALEFIEHFRCTGRLEHPGIPPVYDAGVDTDGNVFYTCRFSDDDTLDEILTRIRNRDRHTIALHPLSRLLSVFQRTCDAVAFAHSRGIVHGHLNASSIVVGKHGGTIVTGWERSYAAPHPPEGDVKGLGHILYRILTLQPPVEEGPAGTIKPPIKVDPPSPSTRAAVESPEAARISDMAQLQERATEAARQALDESILPGFPHCPDSTIPLPLSAIAMKALGTGGDGPYQSVAQLQADLERYQSGATTVAEQGSFFQQLRPILARHLSTVLLLALVPALLLAGLIGVVGNVREQRDQAMAARKAALTNEDAAIRAGAEAASAKSEAELETYIALVELAYRRIRDADFSEAKAALDRCPVQERHWEWGYLNALAEAGADRPATEIQTGLQAVTQLSVSSPPHQHVIACGPDSGSDGVLIDLDADPPTTLGLENSRTGSGAAAISPDGSLIATAGNDGKVRIWDKANMTLRHKLSRPSDAVRAVAFLPDSRRLISCSDDGSILLWNLGDTADSARQAPEALLDTPESPWHILALARTGTWLIAGSISSDHPHVCLTVPEGKIRWQLPTRAVQTLALSPGNSILACAYEDTTDIALIDALTGQTRTRLSGLQHRARALLFTTDGSRLISLTGKGFTVWMLRRARAVLTIGTGGKKLTAAAFLPDGHSLVVGTADGTVNVYDATEWATPREAANQVVIELE